MSRTLRVIEQKIDKAGHDNIRDKIYEAYNSLIDPEFILEKWVGIDNKYSELYTIVKTAQVYVKHAIYEMDKMVEG